MTLLPEITFAQLKERGALNMPSVNIVNESGNYLGTLVIPQRIGGGFIWDEIKSHAEYLGVRGNSVMPQNEVEAFREEYAKKAEPDPEPPEEPAEQEPEATVTTSAGSTSETVDLDLERDRACPVEGCDFVAKTAAGLKTHIRQKHQEG